MGMLTTYVMLIFSISAVFYMMGYHGAMWDTFSSAGGIGSTEPISSTIMSSMFAIFSDWRLLAMIGAVSVSAWLLGGSSFSVMFFIPLLMLSAVLNYFVLPTSFLFDSTLPDVLRIGVAVFFNILLLLTMLEFIRGQA